MKVVGSNFSKISGERKGLISRELKINTNIEIKDVKKQTVNVFKDQEVFAFEYEFKIDYGEFGRLDFKGNILILFDEKSIVKELEENWKDKKLVESLKMPLMNIVFSRCNLKAMQLEEDLGLPIHLPQPKIESKSVKDKIEDKKDISGKDD